MPEQLLQLDRHLFYFINHGLANPFFDWIMPYLRNPVTWIPLYLFVIVFFSWKFKKQGVVMIILLALAAGFADRTSAGMIKPLVKRTRPCRDMFVLKTDITRINCGTGYSFPSTHATDHFTAAFFLIFVFNKKWRWIWLWAILWASLISFAQVYVGVHYPADILGGAVYGTAVGSLFAILFRRLQPEFNRN